MSRRCLLTVLAEPVSSWVAKGEVVDRYLNPADFFEDVHVLLTNADRPPMDAIQRMAGSARVEVTNLPAGSAMFVRTLGWRPSLLAHWASPAAALARQIRPSLIRSYGTHLNAYAAMIASGASGAPFVISVHTNPDTDRGTARPSLKLRLADAAITAASTSSLRAADLVLPVYDSIVPYLVRVGVRRYEVAYNVINALSLRPKTDYASSGPLRVVSVGRQFSEKNPVELIRAVRDEPDVELTLIGSGDAHASLKAAAGDCDRIHFIEAMTNDEVCQLLPSFDVFATHSLYNGISKAVLEAALTGLPLVLNHIPGPPVKELEGLCTFVEDDPAAWGVALRRLADRPEEREALGRRTLGAAQRRFAPDVTERHLQEIFDRLTAEGAA